MSDALRDTVREFKASVVRELDEQNRRIDAMSDEVRQRIGTAESSIVNELRSLTARLDARLERMEAELADIARRLP